MIFEVRGKQVMIDEDIAKLFGYETKYLNRQVQRNLNRFPENYCFKLTEEEYKNLRCQKVTSSSIDNYGGRRYLPYVYTENIDNTLITKYQSQYNNITIKINKSFHDRFIIIDNTILYHCGASFKDLGKKCFAITKIEDKSILNELKSKL